MRSWDLILQSFLGYKSQVFEWLHNDRFVTWDAMENKLIELLQDAQTYLSTPHHIQTCLSMSHHIISDFQTITLQTPTALAFVA